MWGILSSLGPVKDILLLAHEKGQAKSGEITTVESRKGRIFLFWFYNFPIYNV